MAKNKHEEEIFDEDLLIEMVDDAGNKFYYSEELVIPVGEERFALLVEVTKDGDVVHYHEDGEECDCDEGDIIIAKIVENKDGEEEYIEPTDEEFEAVQKAYEELMKDEEE